MTSIAEAKDLVRKLEPVMRRRAGSLWQVFLLSEDERAAWENLSTLRILTNYRAKLDYRKSIRLPPPTADALKGEYHVGTVMYPEKAYADFGLRAEELTKHILIVGMTGMGKTNLMFEFLRELGRHSKPFLVFDWKRSYWGLRSLPELAELKVIRIGDGKSTFKFNPLIPPPGTEPRVWMTLLIDVINHAFFVGHGVEYFMRKAINELYGSFGVYRGEQAYPTFWDVQQLLRKEFVRGREMLWMGSAKRVLAALVPGSVLGDTLDTKGPNELAALLEKPVVLEMDNLATLEKIFLVEALLLWIYEYRKNSGPSKEFRHAIVLEEAHHVLSGKKESRVGEETIIETMVRMIREFGESVIVIDQEPSKLSRSILANTDCKVCFNLGNGLDVRIMGEGMGFEKEGRGLIDQLKVGDAIVRLKERFTEPIHVAVPWVKLGENGEG